MLYWHPKFLHVTAKLFDALEVCVLHSLGQETNLAGQLLHLGHLTRPVEKMDLVTSKLFQNLSKFCKISLHSHLIPAVSL